MTFAENVKQIRTDMRLSKSKAAIRIGMTYNQYCILEQGKNSPTLTTVLRVAKGLGVTVAKLVKGL